MVKVQKLEVLCVFCGPVRSSTEIEVQKFEVFCVFVGAHVTLYGDRHGSEINR